MFIEVVGAAIAINLAIVTDDFLIVKNLAFFEQYSHLQLLKLTIFYSFKHTELLSAHNLLLFVTIIDYFFEIVCLYSDFI